MSGILCKKQRGDRLAFRIQVKEDSIENPFDPVSVNKDTHGPSPSLYFSKRPFYKIGGADLSPQTLLLLFPFGSRKNNSGFVDYSTEGATFQFSTKNNIPS
jgi:hypothetical protein